MFSFLFKNCCVFDCLLFRPSNLGLFGVPLSIACAGKMLYWMRGLASLLLAAEPRRGVIVSRPRAFLCCWLPWGHRFFGWAPSGFFVVRALSGRSLLRVGFPPSCPCDAGGSVSFSRLRVRGLPVASAGLVARFLSLRRAVCGSSPFPAACRLLFPLSVRSP